MKKGITKISICLALVLIFMLSGCEIFGNGFSEVQDDKIYTIMYSYEYDTHSLEVKNGDIYSIDKPLPSKQGYDFIGLYDAEVGGTQYVSSSGLSVSAFSDNKNIVLYPQFKAKTYNLILNYGEANVTGAISVSVDYDSFIPALPGSLVISDKPYMNFMGWYTKSNCEGVQISNNSGISSLKIDSNFVKLCDSEQNLKLYAGFSVQSYTVTFMSYDGSKILKTAQIAHGSNISTIANGITENGVIITEWSTAPNSQNSKFTGEVTGDMVVYSINYSQTISLNRQNCKLDNGYNPATVGSTYDIKSHNNWELLELIVNGCLVNDNGLYFIPEGNELKLSVKLLQPLIGLPIKDAIGWNWWGNDVSNDSFKGDVYGTNISGKTIGLGAYYIKVTYSDDTNTESSSINFMSDMTQNSVKELSLKIDYSKAISKIETVFVYEIAYYYYELFHNGPEYSDWRCSTTLQFV